MRTKDWTQVDAACVLGFNSWSVAHTVLRASTYFSLKVLFKNYSKTTDRPELFFEIKNGKSSDKYFPINFEFVFLILI